MDNSSTVSVDEQNPPWPLQPTYAAAFRCIGSQCEDHCCGSWDIPLDKDTYRSYKHLPSSEIAALVSEFVILNDPPQPQQLHGTIKRAPSGLCPFFRTDHLCSIQKEYGPQLLSATCSIYPRSLCSVAGRLEGSLSLSCPEAARTVLLSPSFMQQTGNLFSGEFRTDNLYYLAQPNPTAQPEAETAFLHIRQTILEVIRNRAQPMSQRLLIVGHLCEKLDATNATSSTRGAEEIAELVKTSTPSSDLGSAPRDPALRLEVVFTLTDALIRHGASSRFQDLFWIFVEGIGSSSATSTESDLDRFLHAEGTYHRSFFEANPYILENVLINYIFQHLFPYGRRGSDSFAAQSIFAEYLEMATQFAWINALLVGVSSRHQHQFAAEHVIHAIQSFTRAIEHNPSIISWVNATIASRGLNTLPGMAILLGA